MKRNIACFGSASGKLGELLYDAMVEVGRLLAEAGCEVVTGGYSGNGMEAAARGARGAGGLATGFIIGGWGLKANEYVATMNCSVLGGAHWTNDEAYGLRLGCMLNADGFVICAGGGPGTMVELMAIVNLNLKAWGKTGKHCAILCPTGADVPGWDTAMLGQLADWGLFPEGIQHLFKICSTPKEAVEWVSC